MGLGGLKVSPDYCHGAALRAATTLSLSRAWGLKKSPASITQGFGSTLLLGHQISLANSSAGLI